MTTKEYRLSVAMKGELTVEINSNPVVIKFENGTFTGGTRRGGVYSTTDPEIQAKLDNHPLYGSLYFCSKTKEYAPPVVPVKPVILPVEEPKEVELPETMPEAGIIRGVTNSQKAKIALIKLFPGTTNTMLPNTAAIRAFAEKHEITFPDWEIK